MKELSKLSESLQRREAIKKMCLRWAFLLAGIAILVAVFFPFPKTGHGTGDEIFRTKMEMRTIGVAVESYNAEYGIYPKVLGTNLLLILAGENLQEQNPRKRHFLDMPMRRLPNGEYGLGYDRWGQLYRISIKDDKVAIRSAGENGSYYDEDDIVWPDKEERERHSHF